jgi:hypothetical protein
MNPGKRPCQARLALRVPPRTASKRTARTAQLPQRFMTRMTWPVQQANGRGGRRSGHRRDDAQGTKPATNFGVVFLLAVP